MVSMDGGIQQRMKFYEKVIIIAAVAAGVIAIVLVLTFALAPGAAKAERVLAPYQAPRESEALVTYTSGSVFVFRGAQWKPVETGELLAADDYVKTFENSYCDIQIGRKVILSVLENTAVKLSAVAHSGQALKSETEVLFGVLLCKTEKLAGSETVRVRAGGKGFGVRGTEFLIEQRPDATVCAVRDGRVVLTPDGSEIPAATIGQGQELTVDETTGASNAAMAISALRGRLLARLADIVPVDTDPARENALVKVVIEVEPAAAEIQVSGKPVGFGAYGGLFSPGVPIPVTLKKSGYKDVSFTITPKQGDNRTYLFRLDLDAPEKNVSAPAPTDEHELRIQRLQDDAKKAVAESEGLKANVEALQKQKADLQARLEDANRKIKDALDKLK
jgi:hypothetical protein